jgi:hypothetical protein
MFIRYQKEENIQTGKDQLGISNKKQLFFSPVAQHFQMFSVACPNEQDPGSAEFLTRLSTSGSSQKKPLPSFFWLRTKFSMSTLKLAELTQSEL